MEKIIVDSTIPTRLDRYLSRYYHNITHGIIEKLLRTGKIKLNGSKCSASVRVINGDIITIASKILLNNDGALSQKFSQNIVSLAKKILSKYILYNSKEFIAINKPEALSVQGGNKISISIDDALKYLNYTNGTEYKLIHRLDKDTSGILLIANGFDNASKLGQAFKDGLIKKIYVAIVSSCPINLEGVLINKIGKDRSSSFELVKELEEGGKIAKTNYKVLRHHKDISMIEFNPVTGRMHQLRFHSSYLGCSIVGDNKYGGIKYSRMLLHAQEITIPSSVFGKKFHIKSKLPDEFEQIFAFIVN